LVNHFAEKDSDNLLAEAKVLSSGGKVFAIALKDIATARKVVSWSRTAALTWNDPRNGNSVSITLIMPKPLPDRIRGRALKVAWELANKHLAAAAHPRFKEECMSGIQLVTDTTKGTMYYKTAFDKYEMFFLRALPDTMDTYTLHYVPEMLTYFGIPEGEANAIGATADTQGTAK
jgi:hypothetical protein